MLIGFALIQFVWPLLAVGANSLSVRLAPTARGESVGLFNAATSLAAAKWTIDRYVSEINSLRDALGLAELHILDFGSAATRTRLAARACRSNMLTRLEAKRWTCDGGPDILRRPP